MIEPPSPEVLEGGLRHPEQRVEVGLERPVEVVGRDVRDRLATGPLVPGVVDQDVEATELGGRARTAPRASSSFAQVGRHQDAPASGALDPLGGLVGVRLLLGQEDDRDVGVLAGERDRDRAADAGVAAR